MLVHRRVTPSSTSPVPILDTCVETTQGPGLSVEPSTFRSEVQRANQETTAPPRKRAVSQGFCSRSFYSTIFLYLWSIVFLVFVLIYLYAN